MAQQKHVPVADDLDKALIELGLEAQEREVYLGSLTSGPVSVGVLAKHLRMHRTYLYPIIERLRAKGFAPMLGKRYQRTFVVEAPSVVLNMLRKKRTELDTLTSKVALEMPKYLANYHQGGNRARVLFYEGQEKFQELVDRVLEEESKESIYLGEAEQFLTVMGNKSQEFIRNRTERGVRIRALMEDTPLAHTIPTDPAVLRESRILPIHQGLLPCSFHLFGRNVIFWQSHAPLAIVIEDDYIAGLMRGMFEMLWQQGTPLIKQIPA